MIIKDNGTFKTKLTDYDLQINPLDGSIWSLQQRPKPVVRNTRRQHNYWFIGDIHSNMDSYKALLDSIHKEDPNAITIQVGDLDLGAPGVIMPELGPRDFFIQGNHDDIAVCEKHPNFLGKFGYKNGVFFCGGAASGGLGYKNEELSDEELEQAIELFKKHKPEIVVTHDCPQLVREEMFWKKSDDKTRTSEALDIMFADWNPLVWMFGHYHSGQKETIDGTDFICCSPVQAHQLKLAWSSGLIQRGKVVEPVEMTAKKAVSRFFGNVGKALNVFGGD